MATQTTSDEFSTRLRSVGLKVTAPRLAVLSALSTPGHFEVEARHAGHLAGLGEQPHLADIEIAQDLRADAVEPQVHAAPLGRAGLAEPRLERLARLVAVQQHHHPPARLAEIEAAIARLGS